MKYVFVCCVVLLSLSCEKIYRVTDGKNTIVAIQPLGAIPQKLLDSVSASLQKIFGFEVTVLPKKDLPKNAFVNIKSPRYRAEKLIAWLWKNKPDSVNYIIGITEKDISTTKRDALGKIKAPKWKYEDWGIMGLGYCPGKSCVISTFRLRWEHANDHTFYERVKKVSVHEIGHNLWLPHCPEEGCVMNSANESIKNIDKENLALCEKCKKKISS